MLVPRRDSVLVEMPEAPAMSPGGIALPMNVKLDEPGKPRAGTVVAFGRMTEDYRKGDKVFFTFGYEVVENDKTYLVVKEDDIIAKFPQKTAAPALTPRK